MAMSGRKIVVKRGTGVSAVAIAGGRTDTISINTEATDVTSKSSEGWRELLADPSTKSVDITSELLFADGALLSLALGPDSGLLDDFEISIQGVGVVSGMFHLSGLEIGAPHDAEATQNITLASSGPVTFTATP